VLQVVPRGVSRALHYTLDAIAYALTLWGYARLTAERTRQAVSAAKARSVAAPERWSALGRWVSAARRLFGWSVPTGTGSLRERAARLGTWLASRAPLPTGRVERDAFFGGRFIHAR
jgi:hypothetical protein